MMKVNSLTAIDNHVVFSVDDFLILTLIYVHLITAYHKAL